MTNPTVSTSTGSGISYALVVVIVILTMALGIAVSGNTDARLLYVGAMTALCATPLLLGSVHGRNAILTCFLAMYWLFFVASDFATAWVPTAIQMPASDPAIAELGLGLAGLLFLLGYRIVIGFAGDARGIKPNSDWSDTALLLVGSALWICGVIATYLWQVEVLNRAFADVGRRIDSLQGTALTVGRMAQPLGILLIAYLLLHRKRKRVALLLAIMIAAEIYVGFIGDSKESALRGVALLLLAALLIRGRIPLSWAATAVTLAIVLVPIFQAYRAEILIQGQDRGRAAQRLERNLERIIDKAPRTTTMRSLGEGGLLGRLSFKHTVQLALEKIGIEAEFQNGKTLMLTAPALIPRFFWPEKPDAAIGQLFNRELRISPFRDVYISTTLLVEFYWNFGWPGMLFGMFALGAMLGFLGTKFDLSRRMNVTRLLVVCVTIYLFVARFEDGFAMSVVLWLRSLAMIAVLHFFFARTASAGQPSTVAMQAGSS
jgi:hypothetical protein